MYGYGTELLATIQENRKQTTVSQQKQQSSLETTRCFYVLDRSVDMVVLLLLFSGSVSCHHNFGAPAQPNDYGDLALELFIPMMFVCVSVPFPLFFLRERGKDRRSTSTTCSLIHCMLPFYTIEVLLCRSCNPSCWLLQRNLN